MINKYFFIITNTMHTLGVDKITLFKTTVPNKVTSEVVAEGRHKPSETNIT